MIGKRSAPTRLVLPASGLTRRKALGLAGAGLALPFLPRPGFAQTVPEAAEAVADTWRHGLSIFGDLKYEPDFAHFDYVNPDAPKGGRLSHVGPSIAYNQNFNTFNSLNMFVLQGDGAQGLQLTFASLMTGSLDEPDSLYGLVAEAAQVSEDGNTFRFRLRPEAIFHDGSPIMAEDVAFSLNVLKEKGHPLISQTIREMERAEAEEERVVAVRFTGDHARDVPLMVAALPIFSAAFYEGKDFARSTMEEPLGSGPYRVGRYEVGRWIEYERVEDWWGADLPVNRGQWNFDVIRYEYFRDRDVAFEAFKSGAYRFREEFTSRSWATGYDFPAIRDGRVQRVVLADETPSGAQGWFMNTRRAKFADPRVREALIYAFDFEWTNRNLMFDSYERTHSFFQNSDLMAEGEPGPEELEFLEPLRGEVPEEVFGEPFMAPTSDGSGQDRRMLRRAAQLLDEAGLSNEGGRRLTADGQPFTIEFLDYEPGLEPHTQAFIRNLGRLGIRASIRRVDAAQYQQRLNNFEFDMTVRRYSMSSTPGESLMLIFGSQAAETPGSNNLAGIADPAIDALSRQVIRAETREGLVMATRALDRVLRAGRYMVPHWYKGTHWLAFWDEFDRPDDKPRYGRGVMETWWHDPEGGAAREPV